MAEYIDREAFKKEIRRLSTHYLNEWDTLGVLAAVDRIPAADVRPMVTCADCKHWDIDWVPNYAKENEHFCPIVALTTWCDWFCADGEKREES